MSGPKPGTSEWQKLVTASKVAAIIGVSPWDSPWSMWHKMRGDVTEPVRANDAMMRGNYLEQGVICWWTDRHQHEVDAVLLQHYATIPGLPWAAATLDGLTVLDGEQVVLEVKTASRMDDWGQPGTDQIPDHYLTQVYWQLAMTPNAVRAYVAVLGPFLEFSEYVIERDEAIQADLIARCQRFYDSLAGDVPPDLDDTLATFNTLRTLNPGVDKGEAVEIPADLASELLLTREREDWAVATARGVDSRVIDTVGIAQFITSHGVRVARQQANRKRPILVTTAAAFAAYLSELDAA